MVKRFVASVVVALFVFSAMACSIFADAFTRFADEFEGASSYTLAITISVPHEGTIRLTVEIDAHKTHIEYPTLGVEYYLEENEIKQWKYVESQSGWFRSIASEDDLDKGAYAPLPHFATGDFAEDADGIYVLSSDRLADYGVTSFYFTMNDDGTAVATYSMWLNDTAVIVETSITRVGSTTVTLPEV